MVDFDRLSLAERQRKLKTSLERQVRSDLEKALVGVLPGRFEIARVSVNMDASKRTIDATEYAPVEIVPQNPKANYNTREVRTDLLISSETSSKNYEGQGFSPWGPPGQEGQTPPEYQNVADLIGKYSDNTQRNNYALNEKKIQEEKSPIEINSVSVAVFVDGTWKFEYDQKGNYLLENGLRKRTFTPATVEEVNAVSRVLETALKAESKEGSISVSVQPIQFFRQDQFEQEDKAYRDQKRIENLVLWASVGLGIFILFFFIARYLAREAERRNRLRQEELARQAQLQQQQAIMEARNMGFDDIMSLEERESSELREYAISLAKEQPDETRPFEFINRTDPAHILNFIQQEHPQTISLILAYLEPAKASYILSELPHEIQTDVAKRIALMDRTSPEIVREVERVLEKKLATLSSEDYTSAGGVDNVVEIINLVDRQTEKFIIESLEEEDPELAEEIKKRMFVFEDIVMLEDKAVQKVLREVDAQELAKALKAVDTEVQDKIYRNMSKRAATLLREDMEFLGAIRRKDVEEAQQKIVSVIRKLEDQGEIVIARSGEDDILV
ncbi:UNVERIFIED_CONTAM: hypothetical protein PYX00_010920 [Menopon gallinae]|uniref:Flagellar motor switch protein FliG n=1 Tax=Menopon gallinae TaxID=328185 RepID=A0AAW2H6S1_9NEOP